MNISVAGLTLWHDLIPILFPRVVCMIHCVALHTIDLVLAALVLYLTKDRVMTAGTFISG